MGEIKAVLFDYGGVLSTAQVKAERAAMAALLKVDATIFSNYYYQYRPEYDVGLPAEEYWQKVCVACRIGYDQEIVPKLIRHDCKSWTVLNQEVFEWVKALKKGGYKLGIISNMPEEILAYMKERFSWLHNQLFDTILFSCELKICKPDPAIYQQCLDNLRLRPAECLFIDDSELNLQAAAALGLKVFHFYGKGALTSVREMLTSK